MECDFCGFESDEENLFWKCSECRVVNCEGCIIPDNNTGKMYCHDCFLGCEQ